MQADKIRNIVEQLNKLPYKCILFDGTWGIGKTYAVQHTLERKKNVCRVSMFGLESSQQIYHEILCQTIFLNGSAGKICKKLNDVADGVSAFSETSEKLKGVINRFVNEKEVFLALSKTFSSLHIIVIDDLERVGENISLEEVLGIVEELKKCNYVKVILVANSNEMESEKRGLLEKYNEKVVDRIYNITEKPEKINWGDIGIAADFMKDFLEKHKVKNLRTLQKAQNFYDDVKLYCEPIKNDYFMQEVRLICFAVVVESIDKLYYKEVDDDETNKEQDIFQNLDNELEHRIMNYLTCIKSGRGLVTLLLRYFKNEADLDENKLKVEYEMFLKSGNKPNYYKTDVEIKETLLIWKEQISKVNDLVELNCLVDEYVWYSNIVKEDALAVLEVYEKKLEEMLWKKVLDEGEIVINCGYDVFHLSSDKVKSVYKNMCERIRERLIDSYIEYLIEATSDRKAFEYSYKLRECFENSFYRDLVKQKSGRLYSTTSFPIDDMNENKYHTCYNIMYILYHIDEKRFLKYCDDLTCDKMAAHRVEKLVNEIVKG